MICSFIILSHNITAMMSHYDFTAIILKISFTVIENT